MSSGGGGGSNGGGSNGGGGNAGGAPGGPGGRDGRDGISNGRNDTVTRARSADEIVAPVGFVISDDICTGGKYEKC